MDANECYDALVDDLKMSWQVAGQLFGHDERTVRRWAYGETRVPVPVAVLLRGLVSGKITVEDVRRWK